MIRFADRDIPLETLLRDLEVDRACDIVAGGRTKTRALERFAETLRFPDWFGRNLDALYELLDEYAHAATAAGQDWTLLWVPSARLLDDNPGDYARIVAVLSDVASARDRASTSGAGSAAAHASAAPDEPARGGRRLVVYGPDPAAGLRDPRPHAPTESL